MRKIILLPVATAFACWGSAAHADLISTFSGTGLSAGCNVASNTGNLVGSCSGGAFTSVGVTASGSPLLPSPEQTTTVSTVAAPSGGDLVGFVRQVGIASYTGPVEVTMIVNNLTSAPFSLNLVADAPFGIPIFSHTFTASGTAASGPIDLSSVIDGDVFYELSAPFGASVDATVEITRAATPEPVSLALFGSGLLGLGIVRMRRGRDKRHGSFGPVPR